MRRGGKRYAAATAGLVLAACACAPSGDLPEIGASRLLGALGLSDVRFGGRQYEADGVTLTHLGARIDRPGGYRLSVPEARATMVEPLKPEGWQAQGVVLTDARIAPDAEPGRPRIAVGTLSVRGLNSRSTLAPWRSLAANDIALLDGDGGTRASVSTLDARWDPVGADGDVRATISLDGISPRPAWLAALGLTPCLAAALSAGAPLQARVTLLYQPARERLLVESATLGGRAGALAATATLDGLDAAAATAGHLAAALADWESIPERIRFSGLAADYVDAGATAACLSASPGPSDPAALREAAAALPILSDEHDRDGFAGALAAYAAAPARLRLWVNPTDPLSLRYLGSAMTSPARNRYATSTLQVNAEPPVASDPARPREAATAVAAPAPEPRP